MPTTVLLANADHTARSHLMTIGGTDIGFTGEGTTRIDYSTVTLDEQGPGGVSSLSFTIFDPSATTTVSDGAYVEFWNASDGWILFSGFVQSHNTTTGAIGRWIQVDCIGIETLLDWSVIDRDVSWVPDGGQADTPGVQQMLVANAGVGVALNANVVDPFPSNGDQDGPIGWFGNTIGQLAGEASGEPKTTAGTTLREALRAVSERGAMHLPQHDFTSTATIDFYRGLRIWYPYADTFLSPFTATDPYPDDYPVLVVSDSGSAIDYSMIEHEHDASAAYAGVVVIGSTAAATGSVSAGTGMPGPVGVLSDSDLTTGDDKLSAGRAWLSDKVGTTRGRIIIAAWQPDAQYRAGGRITITNQQVGLSSANFVISSISKQFQNIPGNVLETWTVSYGALPPSAMRDLRRLTRDTL